VGLLVERELPARQDVAAAAVLASPFSLYLIALRFLAPPTESQWARADPILHILPRTPTTWLVPLAGLALAGLWWTTARPDRFSMVRAGRRAALGAIVATVLIVAMRLGAGSTMPAFIPSEESAGPGFLLSMTAGLGEELLFRLAMLPLLLAVFETQMGRFRAVLGAVVLTGLGFALLHELGPGEWSPAFFTTRFLLPGCAMSLGYVLVEPSFVVTAHAVAHLLIPWLFTG